MCLDTIKLSTQHAALSTLTGASTMHHVAACTLLHAVQAVIGAVRL